MKIALVTDTHWGVRNDSLTFLEYFHKFYDNIFFPYLDENGIDTVIHLGDITDRRKYINYVILNSLKNRFINKLRERNIDFHVIIGNHDVSYKNTNDINSMAELFGGRDDDFVKWYEDSTEIEFDGCKLFLQPWINNENYANSIAAIKETDAQILFGHLEISGHLMQAGMVCDHGLQPDLFKKFDLVASGHFHHKNSKGNINYLGCPYELMWSDYNEARGFHIFDTDTRELTFIRNPYKMFQKVWYNDLNKEYEDVVDIDYDVYKGTTLKVIVQEKTNPHWFDVFMDRLYKADPEQVQIVDDHKHLDKLAESDIVDEAEDTQSILNNYVEGIETPVDKKKLSMLLQDLYKEALHMEV
jgi:DNA repair exonuclease SbcCD nuclease subunit